jgi:phosphoglycerate kinase
MNLKFKGKKALVRVDFNVPLDKQYQITDDTRIREAVPTIRRILDEGGAVILVSHLGRPLEKLQPDGSINREKFSLRHLVAYLEKALNTRVQFADDLDRAGEMAKALQSGEVLLLENIRFYAEEEDGDPAFAGRLAGLADVYVNDAFGTAHRAHASTATVAQHFGKEAKTFGLLMEREIENASRVLDHPERPVVAITGGAKVSDKMLLLERFLEYADTIIIGGGMAYTFFKARGGKVGNSLVEEERLDTAREFLRKADARRVRVMLPEDSVIGDKFAADANTHTVASDQIPDGWMGLDIGIRASDAFRAAILSSRTIIWNGPMGVFEMPSFANGTRTVAEAVADATRHGAFSLVGGGDSVAALTQLGLNDDVSFVSTGGGAMLEFLEGKELPGIQAIKA